MNILVSGAGIAGCTLAWWLSRAGHHVTIVERSGAQRSSGSPVDVEGPAVAIAEAMGIMPQLRAAATQVDGMAFVDARGRRAVRVDTSAVQRARGSHDVEIPRGDLAAVLEGATRERAEWLFADRVVHLAQDPGGVDVGFEHAPARRFDLVIGADGLHSGVRRLVFGAEQGFVEHMGLYVATVPLGGRDEGRDIVMFNAPGRSVTIHPSRGRAIAAFIFWSPEVTDFDPRDEAQHRALLQRVYGGDGWRVPELLEAARASADLYFDAVSRVRLPSWSSGRVTLCGDAAACVSLFGNGTTLALTGAHALATALAEHPADRAAALASYERNQRRLTAPRTQSMSLGATLLVPQSQAAVTVRNAALHLWPVVAAVARLRSALRPTLSRGAGI